MSPLEHRVIGAGLEFVLGIADHRSQIALCQQTVGAFAAIRPPGESNAATPEVGLCKYIKQPASVPEVSPAAVATSHTQLDAQASFLARCQRPARGALPFLR